MLCAVVVFAGTRVILEPHACLNVRTEKPCKKQNKGKFIQEEKETYWYYLKRTLSCFFRIPVVRLSCDMSIYM